MLRMRTESLVHAMTWLWVLCLEQVQAAWLHDCRIQKEGGAMLGNAGRSTPSLSVISAPDPVSVTVLDVLSLRLPGPC